MVDQERGARRTAGLRGRVWQRARHRDRRSAYVRCRRARRGGRFAPAAPAMLRSFLGRMFMRNTTCVEEFVAALRRDRCHPRRGGLGHYQRPHQTRRHQARRPYMVVATAASMDGYTAYGASITPHGSKQTFDCPAPRAVVADLDVIAAAPAGMKASGYADLMAKCRGRRRLDSGRCGRRGADPRSPPWNAVQRPLARLVGGPGGRSRRRSARRCGTLIYGLMMTGFAMQADPFQPSCFRRRSSVQPSLGYAASHVPKGLRRRTVSRSASAPWRRLRCMTKCWHTISPRLISRPPSAAGPRPGELTPVSPPLLGDGELAAKAVDETRAKHIGR